jgi:formamidopyrimidine-DNA glycosylase
VPELPEVETVVRTIAPRVVGRLIQHAEFNSPFVTPGDRDLLARQLTARRIRNVGRHGKFILMELDRGWLMIHLGMTGRLLFDTPRNAYTHGFFALDHGAMVYDDVRQFGSIEYSEGMNPRVAALGPDALSVTVEEFGARLQGRKTSIKALLLNQAFVAGLGNIYVDEILFRTKIHPLRPVVRVPKTAIPQLHAEMQRILISAIERGGSSISDYVDAEGRQGSFQDLHQVYGREGLACTECSSLIRKITVAQRGTHFCPSCQPPGRKSRKIKAR